jgi:hypothetical protein
MRQRFIDIGIPDFRFHGGVPPEDIRLDSAPHDANRRVWSYTFGHLDMIFDFYCRHPDQPEFGVFCEDDLHLSRDLATKLPGVCEDMKAKKLDIVLLGYLSLFTIKDCGYTNFPKIASEVDTNAKVDYHEYPNELWGAQMYIISRSHAKYLLDKYYGGYALQSHHNKSMTVFSSDWALTKDGKRAISVPMLAVEEDNSSDYKEECQADFHRRCHTVNYNSSYTN